MHLPGISGLQLYRQLIQRRKRVPAILLTADWDSDGRLRAEASAAGMLGILYKPFDADTLIQLIRSAV
jgi:CheY-like chemotaxis protein